jgi:hypothetical protein
MYKKRYDRFITDPVRQVITSAAYDQKALDSLKIVEDSDRRLVATTRAQAT